MRAGLPILEMWANQRERETVSEGLMAAVKQYYRDNTDATTLEQPFWGAIETLCEYSDIDFEEIVRQAESELHEETGRAFTTEFPDD